MCSSIEIAHLCKILEQSDKEKNAWRYCISKNWRIQKSRHECSLGVNLVMFLYVVSDTSPLYKLENNRTIILEILHFQDLGDTSVWLRTQWF